MRVFSFLGTLTFLLTSGLAMADVSGGSQPGDGDHGHDDDCPACHEKTKTVCLNLMCNYTFKYGDKERTCTAAAVFDKKVTKDGGEVSDVSGKDDAVKMEVSCEGYPIWNPPARRFTDLLGTRIQGQQGPDPAISLPRGVLHSSEEGKGAGHYSYSTLELNTQDGFKRAHGSCFIWSGNP